MEVHSSYRELFRKLVDEGCGPLPPGSAARLNAALPTVLAEKAASLALPGEKPVAVDEAGPDTLAARARDRGLRVAAGEVGVDPGCGFFDAASKPVSYVAVNAPASLAGELAGLSIEDVPEATIVAIHVPGYMVLEDTGLAGVMEKRFTRDVYLVLAAPPGTEPARLVTGLVEPALRDALQRL